MTRLDPERTLDGMKTSAEAVRTFDRDVTLKVIVKDNGSIRLVKKTPDHYPQVTVLSAEQTAFLKELLLS